MDKKRIYVEKFDQKDHKRDERPHHHVEDERIRKHVRVHHPKRHAKMTTKLISSKEELIQYVNELGEKGHKIDVFKIEDGLYKVVVLEHRSREVEKEEIEITVD